MSTERVFWVYRGSRRSHASRRRVPARRGCRRPDRGRTRPRHRALTHHGRFLVPARPRSSSRAPQLRPPVALLPGRGAAGCDWRRTVRPGPLSHKGRNSRLRQYGGSQVRPGVLGAARASGDEGRRYATHGDGSADDSGVPDVCAHGTRRGGTRSGRQPAGRHRRGRHPGRHRRRRHSGPPHGLRRGFWFRAGRATTSSPCQARRRTMSSWRSRPASGSPARSA